MWQPKKMLTSWMSKWQPEVDIFTLSVLRLDKFVQRESRQGHSHSLSEIKVFHQARHQISGCYSWHPGCQRSLCSSSLTIKFDILGYWNVWVKMTCWTIIRQKVSGGMKILLPNAAYEPSEAISQKIRLIRSNLKCYPEPRIIFSSLVCYFSLEYYSLISYPDLPLQHKTEWDLGTRLTIHRMKWASFELLKFPLGYNVERNETKENKKKMRFSVKYFIFCLISLAQPQSQVWILIIRNWAIWERILCIVPINWTCVYNRHP